MKQIHISQNQKISILFKENDFGGRRDDTSDFPSERYKFV